MTQFVMVACIPHGTSDNLAVILRSLNQATHWLLYKTSSEKGNQTMT